MNESRDGERTSTLKRIRSSVPDSRVTPRMMASAGIGTPSSLLSAEDEFSGRGVDVLVSVLSSGWQASANNNKVKTRSAAA